MAMIARGWLGEAAKPVVIAYGVGIVAALVTLPITPARSARPDRTWIKNARKIDASHKDPTPARPVAGLPHARGRSFDSLDAYLAHLKDYAGPIGLPWYRQVRPGVFRLETGNLRNGAPPRLFTRAQLERQFGFRR